MARKPKLSEYITCAACGRKLLVESYRAEIPKDLDIPPEHIHRRGSPLVPSRSVMCTCGHYTVEPVVP